jgi:hypothetical protein
MAVRPSALKLVEPPTAVPAASATLMLAEASAAERVTSTGSR